MSKQKIILQSIILCLSALVTFSCGQQKIIQPVVPFESVKTHKELHSFVAFGCHGTSQMYRIGKDKLIPSFKEYKQEMVAKTLWKNFQKDRFENLIFLGDNFYQNGLSPNEILREKQIEEVFNKNYQNIVEEIGRENTHAVPGNHDYQAKDSDGNFTIAYQEQMNWTFHYSTPTSTFLADSILQIIWIDSETMLSLHEGSEKHYAALKTELQKYSQNPKVIWRSLALHHPMQTYGKHGGARNYGSFIKFIEPVLHLFTNPFKQDVYSTSSQDFLEKLRNAIIESGVKVDFSFSAHEHSLHFIEEEQENPLLPSYTVISGAAGKTTEVFESQPENGIWTASNFGFARFYINSKEIEVVFFDGETGDIISWENGKKTKFLIRK